MSVQGRHQIILVLLCSLAYFTNLGGTHLWDEDEAHFGRTAREMVQSGDYIVPHFNGEISLHKPILMYWLMAGSMTLFGPTEFALRFFSAVFGIGTILLVYHGGRMLFWPRAGFWSAACLATSLQFVLVSRASVADPELLFFCTLPIVLLIAAMKAGQATLTWKAWILAYASTGMAALAKGPVGIVLPMAVIGLFLLLQRADATIALRSTVSRHWTIRFMRWIGLACRPAAFLKSLWSMRPITGLLVVSAIALPWYLAVGIATDGEWLRGFFIVHNLNRATSTFENHNGGPLYYIVAILAGTFPWSLLVSSSVRRGIKSLKWGQPERPAFLLLIAWTTVWVGAFTLAGTKLPHYVLPAYPAIALMYGAFLADWLASHEASRAIRLRVSWSLAIVLGVTMMIAMPLAANRLMPGEEILGLVGLIPLIGGIIGLWATETGRRSVAASTLLATALLLGLSLFAWAAPRVDRRQNSPRVAAWLNELSPETKPILTTVGHFEESLLFYCDQPIESFSHPDQLKAFFHDHPYDGFLLTTGDLLPHVQEHLPIGVIELRRAPRFMKAGELVLVGREKPPHGQSGTDRSP